MALINYFSSPFFKTNINNDQFCDQLNAFIQNAAKPENKIKNAPQKAHSGLYESNFEFLNWNQHETNQLKQLMLKYLLDFIKEVNNFTQEQLQKIRFVHESWFHVTNEGAYFQNHTHPNHSWSMVFCVNPGNNKKGNDFEQGKLLFSDPRGNSSMFLDEANGRMKREYSFSGFKVVPEKGMILIFPAYLQHAVEPYRGEENRVTVAANFRFYFDE